jgi:hypothetical protein
MPADLFQRRPASVRGRSTLCSDIRASGTERAASRDDGAPPFFPAPGAVCAPPSA